MRITILADNSEAAPPLLLSEHGLSLWIEEGDRRILFDAGQGPALGANCRTLGIPLSRVDAIVLSHGHYDHTGGLPEALDGRSDVPVYAHPVVTRTRYSRSTGKVREIGMPERARSALTGSARLIATLEPMLVSGKMTVTGPIPRTPSDSSIGSVFHTDRDGREADTIEDDQAAFVETEKGVVVILGCAHAGVVETVRYVERLTKAPLRAVIGGMHLAGATQDTIDATVDELRRARIESVMPCHCTGRAATSALGKAFGARCQPGRSGAVHEFD